MVGYILNGNHGGEDQLVGFLTGAAVMKMLNIPEQEIQQACLKALQDLGEDVKKMSCFVKNWKVPAKQHDELTPEKEAA